MSGRQLRQPDCAIEQAAAVVGDWWSLLLIRELAGGLHRFDQLQAELQVSSKVLATRLTALVADGVLERRGYSERPPRFEYHLTDRGRGLIPVLIALQSWGAQHLIGDGRLTATTTRASGEAARVHSLVGRRIPNVVLPSAEGGPMDPVSPDSAWTVIYCFPGAFAPGQSGHPDGWSDIPGARGCTLESETYRDRHAEFVDLDAAIHGISTQRSDQQSAFSTHAGLPFTLLSDVDLAFAAALRLPTFHVAGVERLKRLTLVADPERVIRHVDYPIEDPVGSVHNALEAISAMSERSRR